MTPIKFPEANVVLNAPQGMENCDPLSVYTDKQTCISCWRPNWRERMSILLFARVWIWVWAGHTQPPIAIEAKRQIFRTIDSLNKPSQGVAFD